MFGEVKLKKHIICKPIYHHYTSIIMEVSCYLVHKGVALYNQGEVFCL